MSKSSENTDAEKLFINDFYDVDLYTYQIKWSGADQAFIGKVKEFPNLNGKAETKADGFIVMRDLVKKEIELLSQANKPIPIPPSKLAIDHLANSDTKEVVN